MVCGGGRGSVSEPKSGKHLDLSFCPHPRIICIILPSLPLTFLVMEVGLPSRTHGKGFLGGSVVKNPSASAGDTGLISDPGRSHVLWSS